MTKRAKREREEGGKKPVKKKEDGYRFALLVWCSVLYLAQSAAVKSQYYGEITSPNYPNTYPNNDRSVYNIVVPPGFAIKLTFRQFDLEPSESCRYDYVKISADKKDLGKFCGRVGSTAGNHPGQQTFVSKGNRLRLLFISDFSNEENGTTIFYKGFQAYYQAIDVNECSQKNDDDDPEYPLCEHICHNYIGGYFCSCRPGYQLQRDKSTCKVDCSDELYMEEEGYISSPEYPHSYPPDLKCNYSIRLEKGLEVTLKFVEPFEIDDHQQVHCPYDLLQIQAGERELGSYCGRRSPGLIRTNTHAVDLLFIADDSGDSRGWKVHYTSERVRCPQLVPLDEYSIIKPSTADFRFQDYIIMSCKTGYKLMENHTELRSFTAICQNDGTWHRPLPSCEIVSCQMPKELTNGEFKYLTLPDADTYQSVIQYRCNEPYYSMLLQSGNGTYTCTAERLWKDNQGFTGIPRCLPVCGKPDNPVSAVGKIIGGDNAVVGNFPWQVYVFTTEPGGGALINDRWILTAAHVIHHKGGDNTKYPASDVQVYMGGLTVDEQIKIGPFPVESIVTHPDYTTAAHDFNHDIALIKLRDSVTMNQNIMPICLPWSTNKPFYEEGIIGYVSGFGVDEKQILTMKLKYVALPVVSQDNCEVFISDKKVHNKTPVFSENMFCAGYPRGETVNKDSCGGDSGGAFTVREQETERWFATGIVSWGIGCGRGYGFYTKLNNYRAWMEKVMNE